MLSKVGGLFIDAGKCDLWASEARLVAKYVIIAKNAAFTTNGLTQDDLSNIFLEKNVWRRATGGSTTDLS